jgi:hypothetical protein
VKALFLHTRTPNCEVMWRSLEAVGWDVTPRRYDEHDRYMDLVTQAESLRPELIVYLGSVVGFVPGTDVLRRLRDVAPSVLLCGDASDNAWHPTLDAYRREDCFSVYVSIDGTEREGFLTKLTPVDPRPYAPRPWVERTVPVGYTGSDIGERTGVIAATGAASPGLVGHDEMARFLCDCRVVVNAPINGTGNADHVKGRVLEAGFSQSLLLERRNGATARWFTPGTEYLEYENPDDARAKLDWARSYDDEAQEIAAALHRRVTAEHHPAVFWRDVLHAGGVN